MTLLYRALWSDTSEPDRTAVVELARECFSRWAQRDPGAAPLPDGELIVPANGQDPAVRHVVVETLGNESGFGFRGRTRDTAGGASQPHTVWTTTVTVVSDEDGVHTWVDNEMETDDPTLRVKVGRPRVVDDLLSLPGRHHLGGSGVFVAVVAVASNEVSALVEVLRDERRTLPVIVFTEPLGTAGIAWQDLAERVARRAGGTATVVTLDHDAVDAFRAALGSLAVWGGGVRTYTPAPLESAADGWRHRYFPPHRVADNPWGVVDRLVYSVTQMSTRRRVPASFARMQATVSPSGADDVVSREDEWAFALELEQDERNGVERELNHARGHLERLREELEKRGLGTLFWTALDQPDDHDAVPDEVQDVSDAVLTAQQHLTSWLKLPDAAARELEGIDSAPNAYAWGNTTWRGFRALAAYAEERANGFDGNFWSWCERGAPLAWPATTKKLALRESETVRNNDRFVEARRFPVDPAVEASGRLYMEAHLKISEGGGDLAPRVYFHDDTAGVTRQIHVGFVGPHHLVPNTRS